jgi:hypothetical protein
MTSSREILLEFMKNFEEMREGLDLDSHPRRIIGLKLMKILNNFKEAIIEKSS